MGKKERTLRVPQVSPIVERAELFERLLLIRGSGPYNRILSKKSLAQLQKMLWTEILQLCKHIYSEIVATIVLIFSSVFGNLTLDLLVMTIAQVEDDLLEIVAKTYNARIHDLKPDKAHDILLLKPPLPTKKKAESWLRQKGPILVNLKGFANLPFIFSSTVGNCYQALTTRYLIERPGFADLDMSQFNKFLKEVANPQLKEIIKEYSDQFQIVYDMEGWMKHLTPKKRKEAEQALFNLRRGDVPGNTYTAMAKALEKILYSGNKDQQDPRAILFQSKEIRTIMGPFFYAIGKIWEWGLEGYKTPGDYDHISSSVYYTSELLDSTFISLDYKRFDLHEYLEILLMDVEIYNYIFDLMIFPDEWIKEFVKKNKNHFKIILKQLLYGILIHLGGEVPTGKGNTTEGNTRRNMMMIGYILYCAGIKFSYKRNYLGAVEARMLAGGDDTLINILKIRLADFLRNLHHVFVQEGEKEKGLGQRLKLLEIGPIEALNFLSLEFINRGDSLRAVRPLYRVIQLFSWSTKLRDARDHWLARKMMWCEGHNLKSWGGDLPVINALANFCIRHGNVCSEQETLLYTENPYMHSSREYNERRDTDAEDYLIHLYLRYEIVEADIRDLEEKLAVAGAFDIIRTRIMEKLVNVIPHPGLLIYNFKEDKLEIPEILIGDNIPFENRDGIITQSYRDEMYEIYNLETTRVDQDYSYNL